MFLPRSLVKIQYCREPLWPRGSVLGFRPPGLEFCVWRAVSSHSSHNPQQVFLAQFSLYVHKDGLKHHSFIHSLKWTKHATKELNSQNVHNEIISSRLHLSYNTITDVRAMDINLRCWSAASRDQCLLQARKTYAVFVVYHHYIFYFVIVNCGVRYEKILWLLWNTFEYWQLNSEYYYTNQLMVFY